MECSNSQKSQKTCQEQQKEKDRKRAVAFTEITSYRQQKQEECLQHSRKRKELRNLVFFPCMTKKAWANYLLHVKPN